MHKYWRHLGDYAKDTSHLSFIEHGAYTLILDWLYNNEKPLPPDEKQALRKLGAKNSLEKKIALNVLREFCELTPDGWIQRRVIAELAEYQGKSQKAKNAAAQRWQHDGNANAYQPHEERNASRARSNNQQPATNNHLVSATADGEQLALDSGEVRTPSVQTDPAAKKRKGRERNELLDALAVVGGGALESVTGPMWGEAAKALKTIREVCPDVTAAMIVAAAKEHLATWPKASVSPSSLAKHWAKFGPQKKEGGVGAANGEPGWDWRAFAAEKIGYDLVLPWKATMERTRKQILDEWEKTPTDARESFEESEVLP